MPPPPTAEDEEGVKDIMEIDMLSILEEEGKKVKIYLMNIHSAYVHFQKKVGNTEPFFRLFTLYLGDEAPDSYD